jgi:putative ABC transport system ATP-binding protein
MSAGEEAAPAKQNRPLDGEGDRSPWLFSIREMLLSRASGPGYRLRLPRLDIASGQKIAITGASGCGKSTALDLLGMVLRPESADRFLFTPEKGEEEDVAVCWRQGRQDRLARIRQRHMGYVLQTGGLLPFLNVYENMELSARALEQKGRKERIRKLAEDLGVSRLLNVMPDRLSIGERQRVAIGRALAAGPDVILADEPTAALDPYHASAVMDLLLTAVQDRGVTLVLVTHSTEIVRAGEFQEYRMRVDRQDDGGVIAVLAE